MHSVRRPTHSMLQLQAVSSDSQRAGGSITYHVYQLLRSSVQEGINHLGLLQISDAFRRQVIYQTKQVNLTSFELTVSANRILFNGELLFEETALHAHADWLAYHLVRAGILSLRFINTISSREIQQFCDRFTTSILTQKSIESLSDLENIEIIRVAKNASFERILAKLIPLGRYPLLQLYAEGSARTLSWSKESASQADRIGPKQLIGQIIDALHVDPSGMIGMLLLHPTLGGVSNKRFDSAILATAIALSMGLDETQARELGMTALLRPTTGENMPWWGRTGFSPVDAASLAVKAKTSLETVTSFELNTPHGMFIDKSYYGKPIYRHVSTTLLSVAVGFVDLLQPMISTGSFSPKLAVQIMIAAAGRIFDTEAVKGLLNLTGYYPPGTAVRLNSGDLAVVINAPSSDAPLDRPIVRLLDVKNKMVFNLNRPELRAYSILRVVNREDCPINPMFMFMI